VGDTPPTPVAVDAVWRPTWTQAVSDYRGEDDEAPFEDATVRMTLPASIGGRQVRIELSNQYSDEPARLGHVAVGSAGVFADMTVDGEPLVVLPAGRSVWTDPVDLSIAEGADVVVDVYLPKHTPYATAGGFLYERLTGDQAGTAEPLAQDPEGRTTANHEGREFPAVSADAADDSDTGDGDTGWSLAAGGPFLRSIEVRGGDARAVVVALGSSSTAMGWPQYAASNLSGVAVLNRGISGNRLLRDAPPAMRSWGPAGLGRFEDDVLRTHAATHLVIAYNNNDWSLPGRVTPIDELPTVDELTAAYEDLVGRAEQAGLDVLLATMTPLSPEQRDDAAREAVRAGLNDWIRTSGYPVLDFDAAVRDDAMPRALNPAYAAPDDTHPNVAGERLLGQVAAASIEEVLSRTTPREPRQFGRAES